MGILDGIVEWIAEQIMYGLDLINTSVLGALGCDMSVFLRYFPAAETMYESLVALAIGLILLLWVWNLFKNFGLGTGSEAEDPIKLSIRSVLFILLAYYSNQIVDIALPVVYVLVGAVLVWFVVELALTIRSTRSTIDDAHAELTPTLKNVEKITAEVYKINGSNYFKLRDLGKALDFYVGWTAERGVYIEAAEPYAE